MVQWDRTCNWLPWNGSDDSDQSMSEATRYLALAKWFISRSLIVRGALTWTSRLQTPDLKITRKWASQLQKKLAFLWSRHLGLADRKMQRCDAAFQCCSADCRYLHSLHLHSPHWSMSKGRDVCRRVALKQQTLQVWKTNDTREVNLRHHAIPCCLLVALRPLKANTAGCCQPGQLLIRWTPTLSQLWASGSGFWGTPYGFAWWFTLALKTLLTECQEDLNFRYCWHITYGIQYIIYHYNTLLYIYIYITIVSLWMGSVNVHRLSRLPSSEKWHWTELSTSESSEGCCSNASPSHALDAMCG